MKKNILRVFSLLAIFIFTCTMISRFVEGWMMPRVILTSLRMDNRSAETWIRLDALRETENGTIAYAVIEKEGMQPGLFIQEAQADVLGIDKNNNASVDLYYGYKYVLFSTKNLLNGQEIVPIVDQETTEDEYLLIFSEETEVSKDALSACGFTDIRISGNTAWVRNPEAQMPFLADQLQAKLRSNGVEVIQLFSLHEVEQMKAAVPNLILVGVIFLILIVLWGIFCRVITKPHVWKIGLVLGLIVIGFVSLYLALKTVYLPSSLLPERHIFDFAHYTEQSETIRTAMYRFDF